MRNRNTKPWRLLSNKQNPAPVPLADCGTKSAFDLDPTCCRCPEYRAALRSLDTTRFHGRSNDPGPPRTQEPHCALADVSPLIKDDEDIIGTFALGRLSDSTRVSMTCPLVRWRDCTSLCLFVQSHANAYGSAARKMEHAANGRRTPLSFSRCQAKLGSDVISERVGDMFVMRCEKGFGPLPQRSPSLA